MPETKQGERERFSALQIKPLNCRNLLISFMKALPNFLLFLSRLLFKSLSLAKEKENNPTRNLVNFLLEIRHKCCIFEYANFVEQIAKK